MNIVYDYTQETDGLLYGTLQNKAYFIIRPYVIFPNKLIGL